MLENKEQRTRIENAISVGDVVLPLDSARLPCVGPGSYAAPDWPWIVRYVDGDSLTIQWMGVNINGRDLICRKMIPFTSAVVEKNTVRRIDPDWSVQSIDMRQTALQDSQDMGPGAADKLLSERVACEAAWRAIELCMSGLVPDKTLAQQIEILHERHKAEIGKLRQALRASHEYVRLVQSECTNELARLKMEGLPRDDPRTALCNVLLGRSVAVINNGSYVQESPSDPICCWEIDPTGANEPSLPGWNGPGWYFWNETWTGLHGPFATLEETRSALRCYTGQL